VPKAITFQRKIEESVMKSRPLQREEVVRAEKRIPDRNSSETFFEVNQKELEDFFSTPQNSSSDSDENPK